MTAAIKIAHIGPPLARQGGPAGYLLQLALAAERAGAAGRVYLPPMSSPAGTAGAARTASRSAWRQVLSRLKRSIAPPRFYRPSAAMLKADHGHIEAMTMAAKDEQIAEAQASLDNAFQRSADVLFCHDAAVAERALERRARGQSVWLMIHAPMPLAFYLTWNWAVPEADWREITTLPDVRRLTAWEIAVWRSVDRLIVPCPEAFDELVRIEPTVEALRGRLTLVLSGASLNDASQGNRRKEDRGPQAPRESTDRANARRRFGLPGEQPVGLFLGNNQPYRGLDALLAASEMLDLRAPSGVLAIGGPTKDAIRGVRRRRVRTLGRISGADALIDLLKAVDFVVNVNRFSLFDLSTIEVIEAGKPLLLHAVGGNLTFEQLGAGAVMVQDLEPATIAAGLSRMFAMSDDERSSLGRQSRCCYERHLTLARFWQRHADLYAQADADAPVNVSGVSRACPPVAG